MSGAILGTHVQRYTGGCTYVGQISDGGIHIVYDVVRFIFYKTFKHERDCHVDEYTSPAV